ncbi:MAG: hypothetical protein Q9214_004943, partial [Letrouitia sp. 1 TL-2023]
MADRFPSLEEFGDGQTEPRPANGDIDAQDDFLSRERALLGDDAAQFASPHDNAPTVEDDNDDLLGGDGNYDMPAAGNEEVTEFESSFPAVDTQNNVRQTLTIYFFSYPQSLIKATANGSGGYNYRLEPSVPAPPNSLLLWLRHCPRRRTGAYP